jgi:hypothetical protein
VHLLPIASRTAPEISGEVVREPATNHPSVLVFVPRNVEVTQKIRQSPAGRSNPRLATLAPGHLVGLTIAHEVGHYLGLSHTSLAKGEPRRTTYRHATVNVSVPV